MLIGVVIGFIAALVLVACIVWWAVSYRPPETPMQRMHRDLRETKAQVDQIFAQGARDMNGVADNDLPSNWRELLVHEDES